MPRDIPPSSDACKCALLPPQTMLSPDLLNQLRAMQTPSPSEKTSIVNHISETESNLLLYDLELARHAETTEKLQAERRNIQQIVDGHRSLLAPVRKLPTELLASIFAACCARDSPDRFSNSITSPGVLAPLNLGLVCHLWRDITISTPRLWSTISVVLDNAKPCSPDVARLFLRRSHRLPLTVHVFDDHIHDDFNELQDIDVPREIMEVLTMEVHRFNYVHLAGYSYFIDYLIPEDLGGLLAGFSIDNTYTRTVESSFKSASKLQSLNLVNVDVSQLDARLPFHQITRLSIEPPRVSSSLQLLEKFKNVTEAVVTFVNINTPLQVPPLSVCATSLSSLTLNFGRSSPHDLHSFLDAVTLPSLTSLTISSSSDINRFLPESLEEMISRSKCALEALTIQNFWTSFSKSLFAVTPTLTCLTIEDAPSISATDLLRPLTYTTQYREGGTALNTAGELLPKLKHFSFKIPDNFTEQWQFLVKMLESRCPPRTLNSSKTSDAPCLEQVSLCFRNTIDAGVKGRLRELQNRGLKIWFTEC